MNKFKIFLYLAFALLTNCSKVEKNSLIDESFYKYPVYTIKNIDFENDSFTIDTLEKIHKKSFPTLQTIQLDDIKVDSFDNYIKTDTNNYIFNLDYGEFGSGLFTINLATKIQYRIDSTFANIGKTYFFKIDNKIYTISSFGHLLTVESHLLKINSSNNRFYIENIKTLNDEISYSILNRDKKIYFTNSIGISSIDTNGNIIQIATSEYFKDLHVYGIFETRNFILISTRKCILKINRQSRLTSKICPQR